LERVASTSAPASTSWSPSTGKCAEQVFKVYVLEASRSLCATEASEATKASSAEWVPSWPSSARSWVEATRRIESGGAVRVEGLFLLGIRQYFVSGLGSRETILGRCLFIRVWVVFLRESVVRLLDVGGRSVLVDTEGLVRVGDCEGG
jgi:hypothetical protein